MRSAALANRRVTSFVRRGKRERIEGRFRSLWRRSPVASTNAAKSSQSAKPGALSGSALLQNFALAATPFVALRTRRRGARQTVKVTFLPQARGQRKALIALAGTISTGGAVAAPFGIRLRRQLEGLVRTETRSRANPTGGASPVSGAGVLRERRDEIHRQALRAIPNTPAWRDNSRKLRVPGSSAVERAAVNRSVVGSTPTPGEVEATLNRTRGIPRSKT